MLGELLPELARHLVEAGLISEAVDLFANPQWVNRRAEGAGLESVLSDERIVLSAALRDCQDSQVVRLLILSDGIRERFRRAWADGSAARRIAGASSVEEAASVARSLGDDAAPWADFLATARAVRLGATASAHQILDEISVRAWPQYTYKTKSYGLPAYEGIEATVWVYFFCRVFSASPDSVARLTQRLCALSGRDGIPSRYTVWAALLDRLVAEESSPALIMRAIELAHEAILPGAVPFGYEKIYSSRLKAIEAIAIHVSPMWLAGQLTITLETLKPWNFKGPNDDTTYRAVTPLIEHFAVLSPLLRDPEIASIVNRTKAALDKASYVPPKPTSHSYGDRSYLWARYARSLEALNSPKAPTASAAALEACEIDAGCNDPPRHWVSNALALLETSKDEAVASKANSLRGRLKLPAPDAPETPWSPKPDAKDPFEIGLYELASGNSCGPPKGDPRPAGTEVSDAIRLGIMMAWLRAPIADALTRFRVHSEQLSATYRETYKPSWTSVIARRATALERRGMAHEALAVLTEGFDLCLREGDDIESSLRIVAKLAFHDRAAAWAALERLGLENPIDIGSAVSVVLLTLIKEDGTGDEVEWWLDRLPTHTGTLCSDEHFLLVYGGAHRALIRGLKPIACRILDQFERTVHELRRTAAAGHQSAEWREKLDHTAGLAATFAAFAFADQQAEKRFLGMLNALEKLAEIVKPGDNVMGALRHAFADNKVRSRVAAERYLRWLGDQVPNTSVVGRYFDAERLVEAAIALHEAKPAEARALVARAFDCARQEPAKPTDGTMGLAARMASAITNIMAGVATKESARQSESRRFADAVVSWTVSTRDDTAARQLEEVGTYCSDEDAKGRLLAGAVKAYLAVGRLNEAARCLPMISEAVLDRMEVVESLGAKTISAAQRREVLSSLLVGGVRARKSLAAALQLLFEDVVDGADGAESTGYLSALERSLENACQQRKPTPTEDL